jgi:hypothetical protein
MLHVQTDVKALKAGLQLLQLILPVTRDASCEYTVLKMDF